MSKIAIAGNMEAPECSSQFLQLQNVFENVGLSDSKTVYFYTKNKTYWESLSRYLEKLTWGDFTRYICGKAYHWEEERCFKISFLYIFDSNLLMAFPWSKKLTKQLRVCSPVLVQCFGPLFKIRDHLFILRLGEVYVCKSTLFVETK